MAKVTLYKLTDKNNTTRDRTQWGPGVTNRATGLHKRLCSNGVIHAYTSPHLASVFHDAHVDYSDDMRLWVAEGVVIANDGTKVGCRQLKTLYQMPLPRVSSEEKVKFVLLCAKHFWMSTDRIRLVDTIDKILEASDLEEALYKYRFDFLHTTIS